MKLEAVALCVEFQLGSFQPGLVGEAAGIITLEMGSSGLIKLFGRELVHKVPGACLEGVSPSTAIFVIADKNAQSCGSLESRCGVTTPEKTGTDMTDGGSGGESRASERTDTQRSCRTAFNDLSTALVLVRSRVSSRQ